MVPSQEHAGGSSQCHRLPGHRQASVARAIGAEGCLDWLYFAGRYSEPKKVFVRKNPSLRKQEELVFLRNAYTGSRRPWATVPYKYIRASDKMPRVTTVGSMAKTSLA